MFENKFSTESIIIYVFLLIVLLIILSFLSLHSQYSVFYEWWNNNNGAAYKKFLNLDHVLVARDTFFMYYLTLPLGNQVSNLDVFQTEFLFEWIFPHIVLNTNGKLTGFVKPRHVTKSIVFERGDTPDFDKWCIKNNKIPSVVLEYDANGNPTSETITGVYPAPRDRVGWRYKFAEWGVPFNNWKETKDGNLLPELTSDIIKEWYSTTYSEAGGTSHPDNFLAMYGILPDSPLCASFINQSYNISGVVLDEESLVKLLGGVSGGNPGGWIGYMQGLGTNKKDLYTTYMMSVLHGDKTRKSDLNLPCDKTDATGWGSAVTGGIGIAATAAFFATPPIGWAAGIGMGIFIALGITSFALNIPPTKCALAGK
jgi:hypothetical protein